MAAHRHLLQHTLSWTTRHRRAARARERQAAHHETCIYRAMIMTR